MSTSDWIAYWNGRFVPDGEITIAPSDRGFILGDAAFEAARTYRHRPFHLDWHFDRMFTSLEYLRLDPGMSRPRLEEVTADVLDRNRARLRANDDVSLVHRVTRGPNAPPYSGIMPGPPTVLITCRPIAFARFADLYDGGVELAVPSVKGPAAGGIDPRIKTQSRLLLALGAVEVGPAGRDVLPLFSDVAGHVTESASSNVFFVIDGVLVTAPDEAVLDGITRRVVLRLAEDLGIDAQRRPVHLTELERATEAFITATSVAILPVRRLDGHTLRPIPGELTQRITRAFSHYAGVDIVEQARAHLRDAPAVKK